MARMDRNSDSAVPFAGWGRIEFVVLAQGRDAQIGGLKFLTG